jgi:hypothetical protein
LKVYLELESIAKENVVESRISSKPKEAIREFLGFIKEVISQKENF